jgi:ATP-dependent RNA circularization protein (DNA/RNA ligase family)
MDLGRFPHTPHLAWLGAGRPRDDKILSPHERDAILAGEIVVEEKVDGANVGFSVEQGVLCLRNRGAYLDPAHGHPQFKPLHRWLAARREAIAHALRGDLALYGEWCYARHSVRYTRLPDWLLVFDVLDLGTDKFWSTSRRDAFARDLGLATVPLVSAGRHTVASLRALLLPSRFGEQPAEGLYLRREDPEYLIARAKLVRAEFVQGIEEHWSRRPIEVNTAVGPEHRPEGGSA